jgi:RHS repeat-associated protein
MSYDQANRLATTTLANGIVQDYGLNAAGGITQISYDKGATSYGKINHRYDAAGRRIKMWGANGRTTLPAATTSDATYDLANRLTSWNGQTVTHDADGNLTSVGSQTFSWNARGQLTATSAGDVGYGYDGLGRRVTRSVAGTPDARYLYDGWNLVQEQSGTGTVTANSMLGPGLGQVFRRSAGADRNYLTDAMGSTIALTSGMATPTVNTEYSYEPYGKPTTTGSATTNPFAFTGLVWDGESGLYDNRFRQLNPSIARFGSEDPIEIWGGKNLYQYGAGAPTIHADLLGLEPMGVGLIRASAILSAFSIVLAGVPVLGGTLAIAGAVLAGYSLIQAWGTPAFIPTALDAAISIGGSVALSFAIAASSPLAIPVAVALYAITVTGPLAGA